MGQERAEVTAAEILLVVAKRFGCDRQELLLAKRGSGVDNRARLLAMRLCQEYGSMNLLEIGKLFGGGSESGVSKSISRLKLRMEQDEALR